MPNHSKPELVLLAQTGDGKLADIGALWRRETIAFGGFLDLTKLREFGGDRLNIMALSNTPKNGNAKRPQQRPGAPAKSGAKPR